MKFYAFFCFSSFNWEIGFLSRRRLYLKAYGSSPLMVEMGVQCEANLQVASNFCRCFSKISIANDNQLLHMWRFNYSIRACYSSLSFNWQSFWSGPFLLQLKSEINKLSADIFPSPFTLRCSSHYQKSDSSLRRKVVCHFSNRRYVYFF